MRTFSNFSGGGGGSPTEQIMVIGIPLNSFRDPEHYGTFLPEVPDPITLGVAGLAASISGLGPLAIYTDDLTDDAQSDYWAGSELVLPPNYVPGGNIGLRLIGGMLLFDESPSSLAQQAGFTFNIFEPGGNSGSNLLQQSGCDISYEGALGFAVPGVVSFNGDDEAEMQLGIHTFDFEPFVGTGLVPGDVLPFEVSMGIDATALQTVAIQIRAVKFLVPCYV